jgi:hypothetical protein
MARNLPSTTTSFLAAQIPHLGSRDNQAELLAPSLRLLFDVATHSGLRCSVSTASEACKVHVKAANVAIGLLSDLAVNDLETNAALRGAHAAEAWAGTFTHLALVAMQQYRMLQ